MNKVFGISKIYFKLWIEVGGKIFTARIYGEGIF
jgi:hypothetical protein